MTTNSKYRRNALIVFLIVIGVLYLSSVLNKDRGGTQIHLGAILTLSGSFSSAGEDCRNGIEAALEISDAHRKIKVLYGDSRNEPRTAISEFRNLVQNKDVVGVYTHRSAIGMPLSPIANRKKIPLIGAVGNHLFASSNPYAYQAWVPSNKEGAFIAEAMQKKGYKRIAVVSTEDDWTISVLEGFREGFSNSKDIVFNQEVLLKERDFKSLLIRLKNTSPDAIFFNVLLPQIAPILLQAQQLGIKAGIYSTFYVTKGEVSEAAGRKTVEGVRYVEIDTNLPTLKEWLKISTESSIPSLTVASYVSTMFVSQAVQDKNIQSSTQLQQALKKIKEIVTPDHIYPVSDGYIEFPLVMKEIRYNEKE